MGVPKFFRWLSERYPLINQRYYAPSTKLDVEGESGTKGDQTTQTKKDLSLFFQQDPIAQKDVLKSATLPPQVDRLYIDMNGIIHGCSHANSEDEDGGMIVTDITHEQIFHNVCTYLERVVEDIVQPTELVYMAIDGVAPRAKLNQQRARRYRTGSGQEIEQTVYDAHLNALQQQQQQRQLEEQEEEEQLLKFNHEDENRYQDGSDHNGSTSSSSLSLKLDRSAFTGGRLLTEVEPGRFAGKFETHLGGHHYSEETNNLDANASSASTTTSNTTATTTTAASNQEQESYKFHSNVITPGTPFFQEFTEHMEKFIQNKLANDPKWKHLTIVFSGSNVPGEGEHKIMDFMRMQQQRADYSPTLRHCIQGQDGDLIMLGLVTHEPNLVLFREQVIFDQSRRQRQSDNSNNASGVAHYVHNPNFEFLHMNVLRDYIAFDFETSNVVADSPFDLERTIDDFVFMTFFVGNDFLPAMPALDIADEAFDLLWYTYREQREQWYQQATETGLDPYLTHAGTILSGQRLEDFLTEVGSFESPYYDNKKEDQEDAKRRIRKLDSRYGTETLPSDEVLRLKEESDRAKFREMMMEGIGQHNNSLMKEEEYKDLNNTNATGFRPSHEKEDQVDPGLSQRLGNLLKKSVLSNNFEGGGDAEDVSTHIDDQDVKGRYYFDKFQFTPFDHEEHRKLRKEYITGLVWTLKYYFQGCASWSWYYPYHYGPMISDLKGIDEMLSEISFDGQLGEPLRPFEQLMSCMPPSQAHVLPEPYRHLMTDPDSPLIDFYPRAFTVDMNGKRWPWEAVVLLNFIDTDRLLEQTKDITNSRLTPEEKRRNSLGHAIVMTNQSMSSATITNDSRIPLFNDDDKFMVLKQKSPGGVAKHGDTVSENTAQVHAIALDDGYSAFRIPQKNGVGCDQCKKNLAGDYQQYCYNHNRKKDVESDLPTAPEIAKNDTGIVVESFRESKWNHTISGFQPIIRPGTIVPLPGYPTLRSAPIRSLWRRRLGIDVFGLKSRYKTACLEHSEAMPKLPSLESLGETLIGSTVWVNYPHLTEAFVTSVSNETHSMRGKGTVPVEWTKRESIEWADRRDRLVHQFEKGQGVTGTGGLIVSSDQDITLTVRPLQELRDMPRGTKVKTFAKGEIEIPIVATLWSPPQADPRLSGVPALLEKNPYKVRISQEQQKEQSRNESGRFGNGSENGKTYKGTGKGRNAFRKQTSKRSQSRQISSAAMLDEKEASAPQAQLKRLTNHRFTCLHPVRNALLSSASDGIFPNATIKRTMTTVPIPHCNVSSRFTLAAPDVSRAKFKLHGTKFAGRNRSQLVVAGLATAAVFFASGVNAAAGTTTLWLRKSNLNPPMSYLTLPTTVSLSNSLFGLRGGGDAREVQFGDSSSGHQFYAGTNVPPLEFEHGTTTLSFVFQGGAVVAVDSRASLGSFVGSKTVQKVLPINSHVLGTMAGGAADCSYLIRLLRSEAQLYELKHPTNRRMSTARISQLLAKMLYQNRSLQLSVGTMIVGYDDNGDFDATGTVSTATSGGGAACSLPKIFYVDNSGVRIEGQLFSVGSGSTFALAILDTEYRQDLTESEAVALGIKAIRYATFRDAFSGGYINVYVITPKDGWKKVFTEDVAATGPLLLEENKGDDDEQYHHQQQQQQQQQQKI